VVRLNFSHGKAQDHIDRAAMVRAAARPGGQGGGLMADLQGPKIRVGKFADGKVQLEPASLRARRRPHRARRREAWAWTTRNCRAT
jgi:pyruvate kinase